MTRKNDLIINVVSQFLFLQYIIFINIISFLGKKLVLNRNFKDSHNFPQLQVHREIRYTVEATIITTWNEKYEL